MLDIIDTDNMKKTRNTSPTVLRAQKKQELLDSLASVQHDIWAHWMTYLFSICKENADGSVTIPVDKVKRWKRQIKTTYIDLTEKEKESDREQAEKVIKAYLNAVLRLYSYK